MRFFYKDNSRLRVNRMIRELVLIENLGLGRIETLIILMMMNRIVVLVLLMWEHLINLKIKL
jgi:hypothetical protein